MFIRFNQGLSILKKVVAIETGQTQSLMLPDNQRFDRLVSSRKPFGLETTFRGQPVKVAVDDLLIYQNGGTGYVARNSITTGRQYVDKWKIFTGRAAPGTGNRDTYPHRIISTPFLGEPDSISSETYLCIGSFDTKSEAENALSYLSCCHPAPALAAQAVAGYHGKVYTFVPTQQWKQRWTDDDLYEKYGITDEEVAFIESVICPMAFGNEQEAHH